MAQHMGYSNILTQTTNLEPVNAKQNDHISSLGLVMQTIAETNSIY